MNDKEFRELVSELRQAQTDWKDTENVKIAQIMWDLERRVDAELKRYFDGEVVQ